MKIDLFRRSSKRLAIGRDQRVITGIIILVVVIVVSSLSIVAKMRSGLKIADTQIRAQQVSLEDIQKVQAQLNSFVSHYESLSEPDPDYKFDSPKETTSPKEVTPAEVLEYALPYRCSDEGREHDIYFENFKKRYWANKGDNYQTPRPAISCTDFTPTPNPERKTHSMNWSFNNVDCPTGSNFPELQAVLGAINKSPRPIKVNSIDVTLTGQCSFQLGLETYSLPPKLFQTGEQAFGSNQDSAPEEAPE